MNKENQVRTYWNESWAKLDKPTKRSEYYISNHGRMKSVDKATGNETLLKGSVLKTGHHVMNIRLVGNKNLAVYVHKFVAEHFVESDNPDHQFVTHIDHNRNNNHWSNLKWLTRKELSETWVEKGIYSMKGKVKVQNNNVKLTETKVKLLKKWLQNDKTKKKILAKRLGISVTQVKRIERGENWAHVTLDEGEIKNQ